MPKPSKPSPHPQLCSKISSRSKTPPQGQTPLDPTHWPWVGGLQGLRRGTSAQPGPAVAQPTKNMAMGQKSHPASLKYNRENNNYAF